MQSYVDNAMKITKKLGLNKQEQPGALPFH